MKVAIAHDWLTGMRGGEKVLEALLEIWPDATLYTLFHQAGRVSARIESHPIVTSRLNRIPGIYRHYRNMLPLFPSAIESLDVGAVDLVVSSSHAVAKGIPSGHALHVCYCHTPMRYIWDAGEDYSPSLARRMGLAVFRPRLRAWDRATSGLVDYFIANSRFVADRIQSYYDREAALIYPPVDTDFYRGSRNPTIGSFFLSVGALVAYKRFDLAVEAFNRLGRPLIIVGDGPDRIRLSRIASSNIEFRGWIPAEQLRELYLGALGTVFPGKEDFGIAPVEARACGCPVIAYGEGGTAETLEDGRDGVLFHTQSVSNLMEAVERFDKIQWSAETIRHNTTGFSRERFKSEIESFIQGCRQERRASPPTNSYATPGSPRF